MDECFIEPLFQNLLDENEFDWEEKQENRHILLKCDDA